MTKKWNTPGGNAPGVCLDMLKQPHLLIAGATGSGKSVLINSILYTALYHSPAAVRFILIDPKRVELNTYASLPHVIQYASEPEQITEALTYAVQLMENRFRDMQRQRVKMYNGCDIYVVIDEFADLMTTQKRQTLPLLQRIAQLGRAARVHLIAATQRPTKDIVNGQIKVNMDSRVALRCPTAQDSRNIINVKGAETLPRYGYGYYLTPETMQPQLITIPLTSDTEIDKQIKSYMAQLTWVDKLIRKAPYEI